MRYICDKTKNMNSLYKVGSDWILDGSKCPNGIYRLSIIDDYVALMGAQTQDLLEDYKLATDIDKDDIGTKYESFNEFYEATKLFFSKSEVDTGLVKLNGQTTGYSYIDKFGANPIITTGTDPEDVIEFGGIQKLATWGTAPIVFLSTSDSGNIQNIEVTGLDINGDIVTQQVVCNGQNNVALSTPLYRLFTAETNDTEIVGGFSGIVYFHDDPTPTAGIPLSSSVYGIITQGNQRTLMATYTIPKGKVGYLYRGELGIEKTGNAAALAEYARFLYLSRRLGKVFTSKKRITIMVAQGVYQDQRTFKDIIPALSDIKMQVEEVSADIGAWAAFDILLVDQDKFPHSFLQAIGQPEI